MPAGGRYRIASISKVFTAVVVLRLAAEHRVGLGRAVRDYLPGPLPASYPKITVRELLDLQWRRSGPAAHRDLPGPSGAAGRVCFSAGLTTTTFPGGVTVWGKTGSVPGYTSGVFATRDLRRLLVYSINPTGDADGSETPYVVRIAAAAFDPDLA